MNGSNDRRHTERDTEQGFILMIVCMVFLIVGVAVMAYLRISTTQ